MGNYNIYQDTKRVRELLWLLVLQLAIRKAAGAKLATPVRRAKLLSHVHLLMMFGGLKVAVIGVRVGIRAW